MAKGSTCKLNVWLSAPLWLGGRHCYPAAARPQHTGRVAAGLQIEWRDPQITHGPSR
ncbi:hypothetical protein GGTG_04137 [Gaeumannomyces tritici R3-111a-1]|uniref:Uncharacterized protein n=1 Tax=Gaeumannomyces tritici (strain R3-111a-1) TaxID=644352 RepID=J3NS92_GAET3|nr:hypothetical protein GGTG_04137 [Gaeumannomyces tritici R3-111a-1]EJT79048.1 hypothetical protein GGTG_04137 [Gaeumannomyces tritici R3-111a-1]